MVKEKTGVYVGTKVSSILKNSLENTVTSGIYLNASNFVRDAIKEKLKREGFLKNKDPHVGRF
jgi:Arc/MetJ-type ribon-helix-helix transcriptional regulator